MSEYQTPEPIDPVEPIQQPAAVEKREYRKMWHSAWMPGLVLILLGGYFLLQNMGILHLDNWWALFILLPAFGALGTAYSTYVNNGGRFSGAVRGSLVGGIILTLLAAAFLFDLRLDYIWPVFLIVAGLAALVGAFARD